MDIYISGVRLLALAAKQPAEAQTLTQPAADLKPETDEDLISKVRLGEREALAGLFRRHSGAIYQLGRRLLRDSAEAEDLVQEVFLYVFRRCELFDPLKGTGRSWIFQIAYTQALLRKRKLKSLGLYTSAISSGPCGSEASIDCPAAYNTTLEGRFGRNGWKKLTDGLTQDQCETLRLHFFEGLTFAEIAGRLGQSHRNIRNHHYRGLEKLRKHLAKTELKGR